LIKKVIRKTKAKSKKTKPAAKKTKPAAKKVKTKSKKAKDNDDSLDIVFVDEDVTVDKESELEARKAYLEEARSQESSGD